jgi:hypothetical protein
MRVRLLNKDQRGAPNPDPDPDPGGAGSGSGLENEKYRVRGRVWKFALLPGIPRELFFACFLFR